MWRYMLIVVAFLALVWRAGAAVLPPEKSVTLDFQWMTAPLVSPDASWGSAMRAGDAVRLSSQTGTISPSFRFRLQYPIPAENYPVVVLRYRSSVIGPAQGALLSVELADGTTSPVFYAADVRADNQVRELRRELPISSRAGKIGGFTFSLPPAVTRFEIVELRFDAGSASPTAVVPMAQNVDVLVLDEKNRPVADARVTGGPLERANWSGAAATSMAGRASLKVTPVPVADSAGEAAEPIQVVTQRNGYVPQYLASLQLPLNVPLYVRLQRPAESPPAETPQPETPTPAAMSNENYTQPASTFYEDRYYGGTGGPWWGPWGGYWPWGYPSGVTVIVFNPDKDRCPPGHHRDDDRHPGKPGNDTGSGQDGNDRVVVSPPGNTAIPTPRFGLPPVSATPAPTVPTRGTTPVAMNGVLPVSRYGVTPVAMNGVTPVARYGVTPVAGNGVIPAPRFGVVPVPSGFFNNPGPAQGSRIGGGSGFSRPAPTAMGGGGRMSAPRNLIPSGFAQPASSNASSGGVVMAPGGGAGFGR